MQEDNNSRKRKRIEESDDSVPVGYFFHPKDHQLIGHYLKNKILGKPLSCHHIVRDFDLYGSIEPWEIWDRFGGPNLETQSECVEGDLDLYFFTRLKKVTPKGSYFVRKIGSGKWDGEDSGKKIYDNEEGKCIGLMKRFHYENRKMPFHNGGWIMHEFSLHSSMLPSPTDVVLCRVRKNTKERKMAQKRRKLRRREETVYNDGSEDESMISNPTAVQPDQIIHNTEEESYVNTVYNGSRDESIGLGPNQLIIQQGLPAVQLDQLIHNTEEPCVNTVPTYSYDDDDDSMEKELFTDQFLQELGIDEGLLEPQLEMQENHCSEGGGAADSFSCLIEETEQQHHERFISGFFNDVQSYIHCY